MEYLSPESHCVSPVRIPFCFFLVWIAQGLTPGWWEWFKPFLHEPSDCLALVLAVTPAAPLETGTYGCHISSPVSPTLTPSRLNWCGSASTALRAPLTAAAILLTRVRVLRARPEFYWLGKAFLKIFSPCVLPPRWFWECQLFVFSAAHEDLNPRTLLPLCLDC